MPFPNKAALLSISCALWTPLMAAQPDAGDMVRRARESLVMDRKYEMVSVGEFWGNDTSYLTACTHGGKPLPEPFTIYFEVLPDGRLGQLLFVPETDVARCIGAHVTGRTFTKPPGDYVTRIDMSFKSGESP